MNEKNLSMWHFYRRKYKLTRVGFNMYYHIKKNSDIWFTDLFFSYQYFKLHIYFNESSNCGKTYSCKVGSESSWQQKKSDSEPRPWRKHTLTCCRSSLPFLKSLLQLRMGQRTPCSPDGTPSTLLLLLTGVLLSGSPRCLLPGVSRLPLPLGVSWIPARGLATGVAVAESPFPLTGEFMTPGGPSSPLLPAGVSFTAWRGLSGGPSPAFTAGESGTWFFLSPPPLIPI